MTANHRALSRYRSSDDADAEALIRKHATLIDRCARSIIRRTGMADFYDDLWAAGAIGLIEAARRFTDGHGVQFSSFVAHRIRGAMLDELRRLDHLPRRLRQRVNEMKRVTERISHEQGRDAAPEEIAEGLGVDVTAVGQLSLLDEPPLPLLDGAADFMSHPESDPLQDDVLEMNEAKRNLREAIETLPERLQVLLALRYDEYLTFREISELFKLSEPRIVQLHGQAVEKLRRVLSPELAAIVTKSMTRTTAENDDDDDDKTHPELSVGSR